MAWLAGTGVIGTDFGCSTVPSDSILPASSGSHQMALGVPQSLFSEFSEHEKNKIHGRFFNATFKMASTVAFLADNIGNFPVFAINSVNFSNRRFSGLERCRELKFALNES